MIKIKLQLFALGTNTMDAGTDSVALARQQLYDNFTRMGFGPTSDGITTIGEANKTVKTDSLGDIYQRGNRVAEDFKTGRVVPSVFLNGTNANAIIADSDNLSFTSGTADRPFSVIVDIKNLNLGTAGTIGFCFSKGTSATPEFTLRVSSSNILSVFLYDTSAVNIIQVSMATALPNLTGILGVSYDGSALASGISLYINGIKQAVTASTTGTYVCMKNGGGSFYIGNREGSNYVRCEMSELMLFNRNLSDIEMSNYCYAGIAYSDAGASNTLLTSGSIVIGKRYKVIDAGTGIVINGAVQTLGSEIIATSASVTWNGGKVIQIGCVLDLSPDSIADTGWFDKSGNNLHATYTNALPLNLQNYKPRVQGYSLDMRGANVAAATTITPTGELFHVTAIDATAIANINIPFAGFNGSITIIPDGIFTWTTAGNIALAGTAVVKKALTMTYDATTTKWYPSY